MKAMAKDVNNVDVIAWLPQHDLLGIQVQKYRILPIHRPSFSGIVVTTP